MKILKLGFASLLVTMSVFASSEIDNKVINFEKQRFLAQKGLTLTKVSISVKEKLPLEGWYGYVVNIQANVPGRGPASGKDMLFTNGDVMTPDLVDMKNGSSFKSLLEPKVTSAYYKKDHLIEGNADAKNKVVVFSDPLCPYCQQALPGIIKKARANPKEIALYYYHFPIYSLHPASSAITRTMIIAKEKGVKNVEEKIYNFDFEKLFKVNESDQQKILDGVNQALGTKITLKEISRPDLDKEVKTDLKMGGDVLVNGTPTLFVNGIKDKTRTLFANLGK